MTREMEAEFAQGCRGDGEIMRYSHRDEDAFYCDAALLRVQRQKIRQLLISIAVPTTRKSQAPASIFRNYQ